LDPQLIICDLVQPVEKKRNWNLMLQQLSEEIDWQVKVRLT
jgi:hypothetical protein